MEVKVDDRAEGYVLSLGVYCYMFSKNLDKYSLPKTCVLKPARHVVLKSHTNGILPVKGTVVIQVAYDKTQKSNTSLFLHHGH